MEGTSRTRFSGSMGETQDRQNMVSSGRSLESIEPSRQVGRCWERMRSVSDLQSPRQSADSTPELGGGDNCKLPQS